MSLPENEATPPNYETLMNDPQTPNPMSNVPVTTYAQNVNPPLPVYQAFPPTQTWGVPAVPPQWIMPQPVDSSSPFFQTFLKGKPKALGIVVILAALLEIALGIGLCFTVFTITLPSGIPFWGPVFYIIAGSLTIAAQKRPNICLVKGSLSMNIISTIFTTVALILNAIDLRIVSFFNCYNYNNNDYNDYNDYNSYNSMCQQLLDSGYAVLSILLLTNLLLFCVTLSTSIFGCRSLSKISPPAPQVYVIQNDVVFAVNPGAIPTYVQTSQLSPPYPVNQVNQVKAIPVNF